MFLGANCQRLRDRLFGRDGKRKAGRRGGSVVSGSAPVCHSIVSGARRTNAAEIERRTRAIAGGLQTLGVRQGDCVAILMRNDIAFLEASYATMMLGAYAVPLNWHFKPDEIAYILTDSGAKALIGHSDLLRGLGDAIPSGPAVLGVAPPPEIVAAYALDPAGLAVPAGAIVFETWLAAQAAYDGPALPQPQSMIYTSGTTGRPKGVRRNAPTTAEQVVIDAMRISVYGLTPGVRALVPGPLYHSAPNAFGLRAGRIGAVTVLMLRFDAEAMLQLIARERIDTCFVVPTMFIRLLRLPAAVRRRYDVSSLRFVIHAAAPCPVEIKQAMLDWWGPVIWEFYGATEAGALSLASSADARLKPGTVGRITPGTELRFLDDTGRDVAPGAVGEIHSRIAGYPDFTYHNDSAKRASVERDGFITCGDLGYLDADGYLFLADRKRDMVISGGVNIYPAEIEAVLATLPGVQDCAVFGIPDAEFGEALLAVVEPVPGAAPDPAALRAALADRLADYKLPKRIELRPDLPREDSGKIFKRRLRDPYWEAAGRKI
ncbi:MAG: AMP-binding protein [Proteobacteria bacterium]|nr:AMP-binding protein [Pseudomonadota bacterium]